VLLTHIFERFFRVIPFTRFSLGRWKIVASSNFRYLINGQIFGVPGLGLLRAHTSVWCLRHGKIWVSLSKTLSKPGCLALEYALPPILVFLS